MNSGLQGKGIQDEITFLVDTMQQQGMAGHSKALDKGLLGQHL